MFETTYLVQEIWAPVRKRYFFCAHQTPIQAIISKLVSPDPGKASMPS